MTPQLRRAFGYFAGSILLLALCGCQVVDLQRLQTTETTLTQLRIDAMANPAGNGDPADFTLDPKLRGQSLDAAFGTLADDAFKLAEAWTSDARTQITAYRIAASAAWQSHDPEKSKILLTAQAKGEDLCSTIKSENSGAPGNCAYIAFIPIVFIFIKDRDWSRSQHFID